MDKKLNVRATVKDGFAIALVNYLSLVAVVALYAVSLFIPYINVGTTIAMASLPAEMAKGGAINPLFIFKKEYRRSMGEFFILQTLKSGAIGVGFMFFLIPGWVISVAWSFANLLFVDKDMAPLDALRESNRMTYGNKWRIFFARTVVGCCMFVAIVLVAGIFSIGSVGWLMRIGDFLIILLLIFSIPALYGVNASIYRQLSSGELLAEEPNVEVVKEAAAEAAAE